MGLGSEAEAGGGATSATLWDQYQDRWHWGDAEMIHTKGKAVGSGRVQELESEPGVYVSGARDRISYGVLHDENSYAS